MTELALRPRAPTEIIDLAVRLLRRHFGGLYTIALVGLIPTLLVQLVVLARSGWDPAAHLGSRITVTSPVSLIMNALMLSALTVYADDVLRTGRGDVRAAFERAAARLPVVLGVTLLSALATLVGVALLVVPGVYVTLRFATALPVAVLEGAGVVEALRRAWARGEGQVGRTFVTFLLLFLVFLVFVVVVAAVAAIAGVALAGVGGLGAGSLPLAAVLSQVVTVLLSAAAYPLLSTAVLLLAYDRRVRREGYDVEAMAAALGAAR